MSLRLPLARRRSPPTPGTSRPRGPTLLVWDAVLLALAALAAGLADVAVAGWVHRQSFPDAVKTLLRGLRLPGHYGFTVALAACLLWPFRRHWRVAAALLAGGAVASGVTAALKFAFGRVRPFRGRAAFDWSPFAGSPFDGRITRDLSFPSGDATLAFATAIVIATVMPRLRFVAFGWAVVVAATRVLQGVHYPSDVLAGAVVGLTVGGLACRVFDLTGDRSPTTLAPPSLTAASPPAAA